MSVYLQCCLLDVIESYSLCCRTFRAAEDAISIVCKVARNARPQKLRCVESRVWGSARGKTPPRFLGPLQILSSGTHSWLDDHEIAD
jgi:hypothetical protein